LGSSELLVVFLVCHERFAGGEFSMGTWIILASAITEGLTFQGAV